MTQVARNDIGAGGQSDRERSRGSITGCLMMLSIGLVGIMDLLVAVQLAGYIYDYQSNRSPESPATKAWEAYKAGDLDAACRWATDDILQMKRSGIEPCYSYALRGRIYEAQGRFEEALHDYSTVIGLKDRARTADAPQDDEELGMSPDAAMDLVHPALIARGRVYEELNRPVAAATDYSRVLLDNVDGIHVPQVWAEERAERQGPETVDEMIAVFDQALAKEPKNESFKRCREILEGAKRLPVSRTSRRPVPLSRHDAFEW